MLLRPAPGCLCIAANSIRFVEGVAEQAKQIKLGPGMHPESGMGPMVSQIQQDRVCGYLESGLREGAQAVIGGNRPDGDGYFVEPTILVDTKPNMQVIREEIFGPRCRGGWIR